MAGGFGPRPSGPEAPGPPRWMPGLEWPISPVHCTQKEVIQHHLAGARESGLERKGVELCGLQDTGMAGSATPRAEGRPLSKLLISHNREGSGNSGPGMVGAGEGRSVLCVGHLLQEFGEGRDEGGLKWPVCLQPAGPSQQMAE